jgi:phage shock protein PspC (stress-responsive transcriptional regulator)
MNDVRRQGAVGGLSRPREGRLVAGVCAGLAQRFGMSRFAVRALFVASMLLPGPQILVYVALWVIAPDETGPGTA